MTRTSRRFVILIVSACTITTSIYTLFQQDAMTHSIRYDHLVLWSSDHHPAPATDVRNLLEPHEVRFLQADLSHNYCQHFNLCNGRRKTMKVLSFENMFYLDQALIPKFHAAYANDTEMQSVDAFLCIDPISICELFEPFNKTMIIIATNRYNVGRQSKTVWARWTSNLLRYAADPRTFIGANNLYDVNYLRYFTGLEATLIPSYTGYTGANYSYNGTLNEFLLANRRANSALLDVFILNFTNTASKMGNASKFAGSVPKLVKISTKYGNYKHSDLVSHPAIVHLPYQMSTMSIFEHYRMNVPLFFPSKELTLRWAVEKNFLAERCIFGTKNASPPTHPTQIGIPHPYDPGLNATRYWIQFADFYRFPYITYFDSVEHLVSILSRLTHADLWTISRNMKQFNAAEKEEIVQKWLTVMNKVAKYSTKQKPKTVD